MSDNPITPKQQLPRWQRRVLLGVHISVLLGAVALILMISYDTFNNQSFVDDPRYITLQFWVCLLFLLDIIIEFIFTPRKWRYVLRHIFFFLIAIPYINILDYLGVPLDHRMQYIVGFIPMLRAAYVLAIIAGALTHDKLTGMFTAYLALLVTLIYFGSMLLFIEEHKVNPDVHDYASALWWAVMNMTTAGCFITEYTITGKVLSVILSGGGLMLFPVFTVYITHAVAAEHVLFALPALKKSAAPAGTALKAKPATVTSSADKGHSTTAAGPAANGQTKP